MINLKKYNIFKLNSIIDVFCLINLLFSFISIFMYPFFAAQKYNNYEIRLLDIIIISSAGTFPIIIMLFFYKSQTSKEQKKIIQHDKRR